MKNAVLTVITNNKETIKSIKLNTDVNIEIANNIQEVKTKYFTNILNGICNTVELLDIVNFLEKNDYDIVKVPYLKIAGHRLLEKDYIEILKTDRNIFNKDNIGMLEIDYFYFEKDI